MDPDLRARFNAAFSPAAYDAYLRKIDQGEGCPPGFRMAETPVFLTPEFAAEIAGAAREIVAQLRTTGFREHACTAIPAELEVPHETPHPLFLQVDFGVCADPGDPGRLTPRLIELQGFPSLYAFQPYLLRCLRNAFPAVPEAWQPYFSGLDEGSYFERLRQVIVAGHEPENVILLEIEPERQKTRVDFVCTETLLGVRAVDVSAIIKRGRRLFYKRDGREVRIERIYNRLIFDELLRRPDLRPSFQLQDDVDVEWAGHPNWYFRVSKHTLPFLKTPHCSPAYFADEFPADERLSDYVLKPLYSFAGLGVDVEPTPEKLAALPIPHDWILQGKVRYADFVPTPDGSRSKAEIRTMFLWPEGGEPTLACNLVRMSQGKMMGVDFNKEKLGSAQVSASSRRECGRIGTSSCVPRPMFSRKSFSGAAVRLVALGSAAMLAACASAPSHPSVHGRFRVTWTATRTTDHVPLASVSTTVAVGGASTVRSDSIHPTEDKPAFPRFTVRLTARNTSGVLQLVSRASLLEAARNKKGKLKVTKRNIGALLPIRPGETQLTSVQGDPVHLEVRLERE